MSKIEIEMDAATKRFYQGVASADEVTKAHADTDFPDFATRERMWWFFVGALAGGNHGCTTTDDFTNFVLGASTRAPQHDDTDDTDDTEEN